MINDILSEIKQEIQPLFLNEYTGHDWFHIQRVYNMSIFLQEHEGGDLKIISTASLLHDISDHKFNGGDFNLGAQKARDLLIKYPFHEEEINHICSIIQNLSFKGNKVENAINTLEGKIVQDADRLDAIGAIGIARTFAYGGFNGQPIYNPEIPPKDHLTKETYLKDKTHTINHFYEKLLLLKDQMHTPTAKKIAKERHAFMELYLKQFYDEFEFGG